LLKFISEQMLDTEYLLINEHALNKHEMRVQIGSAQAEPY